jgi:hypothetical protein
MVKCWAAHLGGCSEKQSLEHYVSEGLWDSTSVGVRGLFSEEDQVIGFSSLGANILCTTHNSGLSELDSEIRIISDRIHQFHKYHVWRSKSPTIKGAGSFVEFRIKGDLLERWMIKFLIGLFYVIHKNECWYDTKRMPLEPPPSLVEYVFGINQISHPVGLYLAYGIGNRHEPKEGAIDVETLLHPGGGIIGANVGINGIRFTVSLSQLDINEYLIHSLDGTVFGPGEESLLYHPKRIVFANSKLRIRFLWE